MKSVVLPAAPVAALSAWPPVGQAPHTTAGAVLFEGVRLIAGDGSPAIERSAFVVRNGTFASVGRQGE